MSPFDFTPVADIEAAIDAVAASTTVQGPAKFIAGGTNLLDLMKENVMRPARLVDINALPLDRITPTAEGGLLLGALARNADTAYDERVKRDYPLLSTAILAGASAQLRNMASNGGNLLQRTRCYYFYDAAVPCNKREPGSGCPAIGGLNRIHAIFGTSEHCIATHPSDMCVALAALAARVHVQGPRGERVIDFADFHRLPGERPDVDNTLTPNELVTGIELPAQGFAKHSAYIKLRDRASYAFALVSVAAAFDIDADGTIRIARLALGGVAHKPWRNPAVEAMLVGRTPTRPNFEAAADLLLADAKGQGANDFKIPLARRAVVRAFEIAAGLSTDRDVTQ